MGRRVGVSPTYNINAEREREEGGGRREEGGGKRGEGGIGLAIASIGAVAW